MLGVENSNRSCRMEFSQPHGATERGISYAVQPGQYHGSNMIPGPPPAPGPNGSIPNLHIHGQPHGPLGSYPQVSSSANGPQYSKQNTSAPMSSGPSYGALAGQRPMAGMQLGPGPNVVGVNVQSYQHHAPDDRQMPSSYVDQSRYSSCPVSQMRRDEADRPVQLPLGAVKYAGPQSVPYSMNSEPNRGRTDAPSRTGDDVSSLSRDELVSRITQSETEMRECQRLYHTQSGEFRHLRETHQRLTDDNQELRDLCCFLDDDRQKGRKLAREWQRFGRYTASVMRQEVTAYQNKLRELDAKQQELIKDNLELKELCLYLDEERSSASCTHCGHPLISRDDGDGSSSSTNADEPSGPPSNGVAPPIPVAPPPSDHMPLLRCSSKEKLLQESCMLQRTPVNDQILSYVRSLEARVMLLEAEKKQSPHDTNRGYSDQFNSEYHSNRDKGASGPRPPQPPPYSLSHHLRAVGLGIASRVPFNSGDSVDSDDELLEAPPLAPVSRPMAVAAAMRVLEVQEQLDNGLRPAAGTPTAGLGMNTCPPGSMNGDGTLADGEKALLRQMCNVVWRKLEEIPGSQQR